MEIEGVVLAAGLSERAGCYKLTLKFGEASVIEKCIEGMYDLCSRIIVVGGYRVEELIRVLKHYPKIEIIVNNNYEAGMFTSVKIGFSQVRGERFFYTPGDYPIISKKVYQTMAEVEGDIIVPVFHGQTGHPVLMKGFLAGELAASETDTCLRDFIARKGSVPVKVQDPGILSDIDTIEDYNRIAVIQRESR